MVSILPMVDLLGNTAVDWFCILSYFRLDTLYMDKSRHIKKCVVYSDHHTFQVQMRVNKHLGGDGLILSACACNVGSYVTSIWQHNVM